MLGHITITVFCMQLLRPCSTRALAQARPTMSWIGLLVSQ